MISIAFAFAVLAFAKLGVNEILTGAMGDNRGNRVQCVHLVLVMVHDIVASDKVFPEHCVFRDVIRITVFLALA